VVHRQCQILLKVLHSRNRLLPHKDPDDEDFDPSVDHGFRFQLQLRLAGRRMESLKYDGNRLHALGVSRTLRPCLLMFIHYRTWTPQTPGL